MAVTIEMVAYVSEAPRIHIIGGVAHIWARSGEIEIQRTMSIGNFAKYIERGQRALRHHAAGDEVIIIND